MKKLIVANNNQSMESNKLDILFDIAEKYSATSYKPGSKAYDKDLQNEISDICNALNVKPQEAKQLMIDHLGFTKDEFSSSTPYSKSNYNESKSIKEESSKTSFKELKNKVEEISKLTGLTMHVSKPQKEGDTVELFCNEVFDIEGSGLIDVIEYDEYGYDLDTEGILEYLTDIGLYEPDEDNIKSDYSMNMINKATKVEQMNEVMKSMNNENAYYNWIYLVPDGATEDDYRDIAEDDELYNDALELFDKLYVKYHKDGLYKPSGTAFNYAMATDKRLNLPSIEIFD